MDITLFRTIVLVVLLVVLLAQARRAPRSSRRQQAFLLGAAAMGVLTLLNGLALLGLDVSLLTLPSLGLTVVLLGISVVLLVRAWQSGEMQGQIARMRGLGRSAPTPAERAREQKEG